MIKIIKQVEDNDQFGSVGLLCEAAAVRILLDRNDKKSFYRQFGV